MVASSFLAVQGRRVTDTIWSESRDRLIVTYEVEIEGREIRVAFRDVKKKLSQRHSREYRKLDRVFVLFFDRTGSYGGVSFSGIVPEAFMVPSAVEYEKSDNGYFPLHDEPVLTFRRNGEEDRMELTIPFYLAYYEGKQKYKLFSVCKMGRIKIAPEPRQASRESMQTVVQTVTTSMEIDAGNEGVTEALSCIHTVVTLLDAQTGLPFSDGLQYEITRLRLMQHEVDNEEVQEKIRETLTRCEVKKEQLESKASVEAIQAQQRVDQLARQAEAGARARQDSIEAAAQRESKAKEKRNLWLIIGGVGVAILCFAGNQVFQHLRNVRNQRSMMELSQSLARQAENDAMRRAHSYARCKANQTVHKAMNKGRDALREKGGRPGKDGGKKKFSI